MHVAVQDWIRFPPEAGLPQSLGSLQSSVTPARWLDRLCRQEELKVADVWIKLFHQQPLLTLRQRLGPLQQFSVQQPGRIPDLQIGEASEMEIGRFDEGKQTLQVVAGLLRMQIHVGEVGIGGAVHGPALAMVSRQSVALRQRRQQLPAEAQALASRADIKQGQGLLGAVDLPAAGIRIQEEMEQTIGGQAPSQRAQTRLRLIQMVQHPDGVDVVERSFALQVQQAALLLAQLAHLGRCTGTLQSLPGHRQCPLADVDP